MWDDLPKDVQEELSDKKYSHRQHYSRSTYALGCRGPLCRKSERDRGLRRNAEKAKQEGKVYEPIKRAQSKRDDELDKIIKWHLEVRHERKAS